MVCMIAIDILKPVRDSIRLEIHAEHAQDTTILVSPILVSSTVYYRATHTCVSHGGQWEVHPHTTQRAHCEPLMQENHTQRTAPQDRKAVQSLAEQAGALLTLDPIAAKDS